MACSWIASSPLRVSPKLSKAPALISDSTRRLLQTPISTLAMKSPKSANRPLAVRVRMIESTTLAPTLRIAESPKRMSVPTGAKSDCDSLTSGGRTLMPMRRHSLR